MSVSKIGVGGFLTTVQTIFDLNNFFRANRDALCVFLSAPGAVVNL